MAYGVAYADLYYRAAGYVTNDRKQVVDVDMAQAVHETRHLLEREGAGPVRRPVGVVGRVDDHRRHHLRRRKAKAP